MSVVAKFTCTDRTDHQNGVDVRFTPVSHENDPEHLNYKFWQATPSGSLHMFITNLDAADYFQQGAVYTVMMAKEEVVPSPKPGATIVYDLDEPEALPHAEPDTAKPTAEPTPE